MTRGVGLSALHQRAARAHPAPRSGEPVVGRSSGRPTASQWWSKRFTTVLEGYGLGSPPRPWPEGARSHGEGAPAGSAGARLPGGALPMSVRWEAPEKAQWRALESAMTARLRWTAQLLNGEMPQGLEDAFADVGVPLSPRRWSDPRVRRGGPDDAEPRKLIAVLLHVFAHQLDDDPWLLLAWHGQERDAPLNASARESRLGRRPIWSAGWRLFLPGWWRPRGRRARSRRMGHSRDSDPTAALRAFIPLGPSHWRPSLDPP